LREYRPPTVARCPRGRWKERAMFLIVLVAIVAVIMIAAVQRIRRKR
jgi:hypothetical protein